MARLSPKQEHNKTITRLRKFNIADTDIESVLPRNLKYGWVLHEELLPDGNTLVEYRHANGDPHTVSFVTADPKHAKGMLLLWLKENRVS